MTAAGYTPPALPCGRRVKVRRWISMPDYSLKYFEHFREGSARSADIVVPLVRDLFAIESVADFGCGVGTWLSTWRELGVDDIVGCDGPHVDSSTLLFPPDRFVAVDLAMPVRLGRRFDLAQSLEVAEHLPANAAPTLVNTLVTHAPVVLFSAASPGQGGEHHLNEQPLEYWRRLFLRHRFHLLDALRPRLVTETTVEWWYRYNSVLFVAEPTLDRLDSELLSCLVSDDTPVRDYAPLRLRLLQQLLRHVPEPVVTRIAKGVRRLNRRRP